MPITRPTRSTQPLSRRRVLRVLAATAGLAALPSAAIAMDAGEPVIWRGNALGAIAEMHLHHPDAATARHAVSLAVAEVRRLERIFSLHRSDSALAVLNRQGVLEAPPRELVAVLDECRMVHALSGGAFDPSVQPLWALYEGHFAGKGGSEGPPPRAVADALAQVGFDRVIASESRIVFGRRGMALTLNGIAQGYITDRVAALLRRQGFDHCLVDMGEPRALGARPDGSPWRIGIADPLAPSRIARTVPIVDRAVATSGGYGFRFDETGRFNHLFDPRTGRSATLYRSITTVMATAVAADAWSTAFSLMPVDRIEPALRKIGSGTARLTLSDGTLRMLSA